MEQLTEQDKRLLEYYYKKQRQKKYIVLGVVLGIFFLLLIYVGYSINTQTKWNFREKSITIEYGTPYEANLGALVDTNKYQFITYDTTTITTNMVNEKDKNYAPVGNYLITINYSGTIKLFGLSKQVKSEKSIDVQIKDTTSPNITSPDKIEILVGQEFEPKQYAYLFKIEDLSKTEDIVFDTSNIDINTVGEYKLFASVEDIYENKSECEILVSVIEDPYNEEEIPEPTTEQTKKTSSVSETTTTQQTTKTTTTKKAQPQKTSKEYKNKDFLFSDGYTMSTVSDAAYNYLKESGKSGECIPIKDDEGLYIGMRVIIYN